MAAKKPTDITEQLRRDEGEKLQLYKDHLGYLTIGIGRLLDPRKGGGISKEESAMLFRNDVVKKQQELYKKFPWAQNLSDARQGVLLNMAFQMGIEGLSEFKNTLAMIKAGDYATAAAGMLNSKWAKKQTPERALRLSKQMETDTWQ